MNPAPPVTSRCPNERSSSTVLGDRPGDGRLEPAGGVILGRDLGRAKQGRHGPGVGPVTLVDAAEQGTQRDVVVEHVGDLELAATGRQEAVDDLEGVGPEEAHADGDEVDLWMLRLLFETDDVPVGV